MSAVGLMPDPATKTCEIFLIVDEDGDYEVAIDLETAHQVYDDNIGGSILNKRIIKIMAKVDLPKPAAIEITVPAEAGTLEVAAE